MGYRWRKALKGNQRGYMISFILSLAARELISPVTAQNNLLERVNMRLVPITLREKPDEIHTYLQQSKSRLLSKARIVNHLHWAALKHAAALVQANGGAVVEIGCGEGYLICTLSKYFDRVVAVDVSGRCLMQQGHIFIPEYRFCIRRYYLTAASRTH